MRSSINNLKPISKFQPHISSFSNPLPPALRQKLFTANLRRFKTINRPTYISEINDNMKMYVFHVLSCGSIRSSQSIVLYSRIVPQWWIGNGLEGVVTNYYKYYSGWTEENHCKLSYVDQRFWKLKKRKFSSSDSFTCVRVHTIANHVDKEVRNCCVTKQMFVYHFDIFHRCICLW